MSFKLQFKRRSQNEILTLSVLVLMLCFGFFFDFLHLPGILKYSIDIVWLFLLVTIVINRFRMPNKETNKLLQFVLIFGLCTLIGFALNPSNPLYYLWGFRNNFRFFVFFFACTMFLRENTVEDVFGWFEKLHYLNFILTLFQFFFLSKRHDYLGGIFGVQVGCNSKTIIFLSIITALSVVRYLNGKKKLTACLTECGISLVIAALAELKFFFVLFALIVAMATLITNFSMKKLQIILFSAVGIYLGTSLLVAVFPQWEGTFNIERMIGSAMSLQGYTGHGDMNRLTTIPITWNQFLTTWPKRLFGLGLGNCDTSAFSFLNTPFYQRYAFLRYNWFSTSFMFLETGISGLVTYLSFFVSLSFWARKRERSSEGRREWCQLARLLAPICVLLIIYNASMRVEEAYLMYFVLALPFIKRNIPLNAELHLPLLQHLQYMQIKR